jgi:two-component system chemotaxis response regulator CheB
VVIGASAGGVDALLHAAAGLPAATACRCSASCTCRDRESRLAELFASACRCRCKKPPTRKPSRPAPCTLPAPGYHLSVERDRTFSLSCEPPVHFARPAIDVLMESAPTPTARAWPASC